MTQHWLRAVAVAIVGLAVQAAVLDQIAVLGAHPDLMILLAGAAGAVCGSGRGASIAFVLGLLADLVVPTPYGLSPLTFVLVAFGAGVVRQLPGDRDGTSTQVATCLCAGVVGTALYAVLGEIAGQQGMVDRQLVYILLVVAVAAVVLTYPCVAAMRWVARGADRVAIGHPVPSGGSASR